MPEVATFERFVLTLDLLYAIGAIEMNAGLLHRCHR
ncbi:ABC-three component system middle component 6 [Nostoc sp. C052]